MVRELKQEVRRRIAPYLLLDQWMLAKRPGRLRVPRADAQRHRKEWMLKMAGLAPWPTPQAYKSPAKKRRR